MKNIITLLLLQVAFIANAQNSCGIYATRADFLENKVTYAFDNCDVKVRMDKDIVARHSDTKLRFDFDFIYGYTDGTNLYRSYGRPSLFKDAGYYKVIFDGDVVVYERIRRDHRNGPRSFYYYSLSKDSPIAPLKSQFYTTTAAGKAVKLNLAALRQSLKIEFSADPAFHLVDLGFEKKKPDISARLQTTTRRPKVL